MSERNGAEPTKQLYYTEGYISWIEIGGNDCCSIKIDPADGWWVNFKDRRNILLANTKDDISESDNDLHNSNGEGKKVGPQGDGICGCVLKDAKCSFKFYDGSGETVPVLGYGFILELKMKRILCGFRVNRDFDIYSIEVK